MQQTRKYRLDKQRSAVHHLLCGIWASTVKLFISHTAHLLWKYLRTEELAQSVFGRLSFWLCFLCRSLCFLFGCRFHRFACWLGFDFHSGGLRRWRRRHWHPFRGRGWLRYLRDLFEREQVWTWWVFLQSLSWSTKLSCLFSLTGNAHCHGHKAQVAKCH